MGVRQRRDRSRPLDPRVPRSLDEAIQAACDSPVVREILSPAVVDNLIRIAKFEAETVRGKVTDIERRRYLEMA